MPAGSFLAFRYEDARGALMSALFLGAIGAGETNICSPMASDLDEFAEDEAYADSVEDMCLDAYLEGVERDNAALRLQRAERLRCARAAAGRLRQLRKAATFIQCCARGHIARNMSRGMAVKQHNAAVTLQRFERGRSARYALRAERARLRRARLLAVGCVQRLTRGRIARRGTARLRTVSEPTAAAATALQTVWRGRVARKEAEALGTRRGRALLALTRACLGFKARRAVRFVISRRHDAAVTLQRFERGRSARYALRAERARLRRARLLAVGCVQRLTRGRIARREVHAPPHTTPSPIHTDPRRLHRMLRC